MHASEPEPHSPVIAKIATDESADKQIRRRLQRQRWALELSTYEVATRAENHGFTNCTAKKVWQIENGKRGFSRDELLALAQSLETTVHDLSTGLEGQPGEPVFIRGATARAHAGASPGNPG
jgi:hypothetical protein